MKVNQVLCALLLLLNAFCASAGVTFTNLHSFDASTFANGLLLGADGFFYSVIYSGGTNASDSILRLTSDGTVTKLISFNGTNGSGLTAPIMWGGDGNFYGTTSAGGTNGNWGTVFKINGSGILTSLISFNKTNGAVPLALVRGFDGNLYGVTWYGGTNFLPIGAGTFFKITTNGTFTSLYSFGSIPDPSRSPSRSLDGTRPGLGLVQSKYDGNFYGTTLEGGTGEFGMNGTIFRITPNGSLVTLFSFNGTNGASPMPLVQGLDGNFYGATSDGGTNGTNDGTIFKFTTNGALTSLASFEGTGQGANPTLMMGADGNFYGTTLFGGTNGSGTIFRMTITGKLTILHTFSALNDNTNADGGQPAYHALVQGNDGNLYGTTGTGGTNGRGTFFRLSVPMPPVFKSVTKTGGAIKFTWSAVAGQVYQAQFKSDLNSTNWLDWGSAMTATNGTMSASDVIDPGTRRFYRIALIP